MKNTVLTIVGAVGSFVIAFMVVVAIGGNARKTESGSAQTAEARQIEDRSELSRVVEKMAATANGMRGENVASNVIVEKATIANGGKVVTYHYRITNVSADNYDRALAQKLKTKLQKKACRDRVNKKALALGAEVRYAYKGSQGVRFFTIPINRGVCREFA